MVWSVALKHQGSGLLCRRQKVEKIVEKNGEEFLAAKSPYHVMRDLGPILIDK